MAKQESKIHYADIISPRYIYIYTYYIYIYIYRPGQHAVGEFKAEAFAQCGYIYRNLLFFVL